MTKYFCFSKKDIEASKNNDFTKKIFLNKNVCNLTKLNKPNKLNKINIKLPNKIKNSNKTIYSENKKFRKCHSC
jgi:hypothetical protein